MIILMYKLLNFINKPTIPDLENYFCDININYIYCEWEWELYLYIH